MYSIVKWWQSKLIAECNASPYTLAMRIRQTYLCTIIIYAIILGGCINQERPDPQLHFDATVANDFRTLANETWQLFLATFATRADCFDDVTLRTDPNLGSRATYDPKTATITVKVPGAPAFLQAALVHEWAHHVEFQCEGHKSLRPALLKSLGLPPETHWHTGHEWEDTPSEHYAEATVELVLGYHPLPTKIRVNQDVVALLKTWTNGN